MTLARHNNYKSRKKLHFCALMSNNKKTRLPAEWEAQDAVLMTFPHAQSDWAPVLSTVMPCFIEIASAISRYQPVLVVCRDKTAIKRLKKLAIPTNVYILPIDSNDTWARDHGGITVFKNGEPQVLDFIFNGWGLKFPADKDNLITGTMAKMGAFKSEVSPAGMVLEGGAIESDGAGTVMTTSFCLDSPNRNPHFSRKKTEKKLCKLFGAKRILRLENGYLAGDDTDSHIDTLARFCDKNTIAYVSSTDRKDEHFKALKAMEAELRQFRTEKGEPYQLVALPMPDARYDADGHRLPATYANFLILNGAVLMPIYGVKQDATALEILRSVFPKLEVIGIDCSALILQHGSLHCVTMQFPAGSINFKTLSQI